MMNIELERTLAAEVAGSQLSLFRGEGPAASWHPITYYRSTLILRVSCESRWGYATLCAQLWLFKQNVIIGTQVSRT